MGHLTRGLAGLALLSACSGDPGGTSTGSESSGSMESSGSTESEGSNDTDTSTEETGPDDPPLEGQCGTANLTGCYRGMYLSLYTDHTGQIQFGGDTEQHRYILGDGAKEQLVLDFIVEHRIESLSLYDLATILDDESLWPSLASFMDRARDAGVLRIDAIGSTATNTWDRIAEFHEAQTRFDGFATEIEFWNGGATFEEFIGILEYVRAKQLLAPSGEPTTLSVYVGWLEQSQVDAMLPLIDRAMVHVYVNTADTAFDYGEERFEMFATANEAQQREVEIWPIFSAEDTEWSAGEETFMGEWLTVNGLDAAELTLLGELEAAPVHARIELTGHQYFSYFFLERYLP